MDLMSRKNINQDTFVGLISAAKETVCWEGKGRWKEMVESVWLVKRRVETSPKNDRRLWIVAEKKSAPF